MCYVYGVADGVGSSAVGASSAAPPRRLAASGVCQSLSVVMSCKSSASYSRLRTVVREDQTAEEVRRYAATPASWAGLSHPAAAAAVDTRTTNSLGSREIKTVILCNRIPSLEFTTFNKSISSSV